MTTRYGRRRHEVFPLLVGSLFWLSGNLWNVIVQAPSDVSSIDEQTIVHSNCIAALVLQRAEPGKKKFVSFCQEVFYNRLP
jgi:hypothetical protein